MKSRYIRLVCVFTLILIFTLIGASAIVTGDGSKGSEVVVDETYMTDRGFQVEVEFHADMTAHISFYNLNGETASDSFSIAVHRKTVVIKQFELSKSEKREWTFDLANKQDPSAHKQQIEFAVFGPNVEYTYDRTATAEDRDEMPLPYISDVDVLTNADGNTEIHVAVENPTQHMLRQHIVVHTEETTHRTDWPSPEPNETETSVIELNEDPNTTVRGEVRLHTGNSSDMRDSLDMVEFEVEPDGDVRVEVREYETIEPSYNYVPDDAEPEDDDRVDVPLDGADSVSTDALLALTLLAGGGILILGLFGVGITRRR